MKMIENVRLQTSNFGDRRRPGVPNSRESRSAHPCKAVFPNTWDDVLEQLCETHLRGAGYTLNSRNMAKIGKQWLSNRSLQILKSVVSKALGLG